MLLFAGFSIDQQRAELRGSDGEAIKLRHKTFDMLCFLAGNAGQVHSKQELMERFWPGVHVGEDSLFQCIREIRTAIGDDRRQLVRNISGRGYLFEAIVTRSVPAAAIPHLVNQDGVAPETNPTAQAMNTPAVIPQALVVTEPAALMPAAHEPATLKALTGETIAPGHAIILAQPFAADAAPALPPLHPVPAPRFRLTRPRWIAIAAGLVVIVGILLAKPVFDAGQMFQRAAPTVAVMQIVAVGDDQQLRKVAADVTERLSAGLARIENIRVITPAVVTAHASLAPGGSLAGKADYVLNGELQSGEHGWTLRARLTGIASDEIAWTSTITVPTDKVPLDIQQSRLAAGIGHPLAVRLNTIINDALPKANGASGNAKVVVEQATASIKQTTPERFRAAQDMLEKALGEYPDDVDLNAALAALQLRGIQMVWYSPEQREQARSRGQAMLERALRSKPSYIPVLESYCRYLSATNRFVESLVACARTLSFDPWNGIAIYHIGLGQIFLGRFEDSLANFMLADRYDTPAVSRWTWLLGAGMSFLFMERDEEALLWLQRSLAVTPGTGRTHLLMVTAYQRLGRFAEAQALLGTAMKLRPGVTANNVSPPAENTSPVYREISARLRELMVEAGLPRS